MPKFDDLSWIEDNLTEDEPVSVLRALQAPLATAREVVPIRELAERPHLVLSRSRARLARKKKKPVSRRRPPELPPTPDAA